ncbi:MAG: protein translocase subunit SecDF [Bacteroidetes bacterium GWD2_45_23]|nr:MAG: protein translocase subunit SecDF [Bacteroidetes bacterium GWC2_46_850]OFX84617.1 MAG: protein translocase subunit SecDF [Bacteroidetes bacterium GWD2_45_23]HBB00151.1 protein translocase subunit SecDF [Porphyromonadaceae bacterium]HCC18174.1 protein translocase subunit SecDF [Porphyromonadaceae bacterium]
MQNKGFIQVFSIILTAICLFYLSFTVVGRQYNKKADQYANGNLALKNHYFDSLSTEKVYLNYTLKQIREKEIGLGLDLKGGMNVVLEIDASQVLASLANTDDPLFNQALKETIVQNRRGSSSDFISLFQQNYERISPDGKLANIYSITIGDRVNPTASNSEVISVLRNELKSVADNSFNVLATRIDRFGVVAPNIQRLDRAERILVELPGITEPERVRNLLQGSANLEFWKTYNLSELGVYFNEMNSRSGEYAMAKRTATADAVVDSAMTETPLQDSLATVLPASADLEATLLPEEEQELVITKSFVEYFNEPYFAMSGASGPIVGSVSKLDTAAVNFLLERYKDVFPADVRFKWGFKPIDQRETYFQLFALKGDGSKRGPALGGDVVTNARADQGQQGSAWEVTMAMNSAGASRWATITGAEIGKSIAIVLDNYVYSAPTVNGRIDGGRSSITGNFTPQEAQDLENVLKSGKMQAGVRIVQEDVVGPSLGQEAIQDGFISFIIALAVLFIFTCMLYGFTPGMVINGALLLNFFFTLGALAAFQAVLTLPGIAGMILSLAMAVDANVLINERIKEELAAGKTLRRALEDGYKNAFSAIFDSNLTTIITGIILAIFGAGAIRGFAITLIIGIAASFLTAVFLTRLVYENRFAKGKWQQLTFNTGFSKAIFKEYSYNFIHNSKKILLAIALFVVISVISLFTLKMNVGIDFTGGRNYIVRFDQPVKTGEVQNALAPIFGESVRVITIGSSNQVRISTNYMIDTEGENVEQELRDLLGQGLADYISPGQTIDDHIQSSQKVGPSIAEDMIRNAFFALTIALICMGLYILFRFNNFAFSMGTVAALAVDTFAVIGLYSLLWKVMPFSMEIDQTFVAAILTIVGYSINDKVVVFDRVREYTQLYPKRGLLALFNDSMNATLARTINTGLSTILVIICILFLGGDAVRSFVFAMLIGVVVGTITSLFVAAPVAYKMMSNQQNKKLTDTKK